MEVVQPLHISLLKVTKQVEYWICHFPSSALEICYYWCVPSKTWRIFFEEHKSPAHTFSLTFPYFPSPTFFLKLARDKIVFCDSLFSLLQNTLLFIADGITTKNFKYWIKDMLFVLWGYIFTSLQVGLLYGHPSVQ